MSALDDAALTAWAKTHHRLLDAERDAGAAGGVTLLLALDEADRDDPGDSARALADALSTALAQRSGRAGRTKLAYVEVPMLFNERPGVQAAVAHTLVYRHADAAAWVLRRRYDGAVAAADPNDPALYEHRALPATGLQAALAFLLDAFAKHAASDGALAARL